MFRIPNIPWANWSSYLEGGGLQGEEIVKSTLFCKVHYVLNSDIKNTLAPKDFIIQGADDKLGQTPRTHLKQ